MPFLNEAGVRHKLPASQVVKVLIEEGGVSSRICNHDHKHFSWQQVCTGQHSSLLEHQKSANALRRDQLSCKADTGLAKPWETTRV
mmetsp:Transcript_42510/g.69073  ORF Transcript_42510/g.69073 Transcript_42510/m.69073 type:complete len:86 (-) Transcript_42510:430-687(-)